MAPSGVSPLNYRAFLPLHQDLIKDSTEDWLGRGIRWKNKTRNVTKDMPSTIFWPPSELEPGRGLGDIALYRRDAILGLRDIIRLSQCLIHLGLDKIRGRHYVCLAGSACLSFRRHNEEMTGAPSLKEALAAYRFGQWPVGFMGSTRPALAPMSLTAMNPDRVKCSAHVCVTLRTAVPIVDCQPGDRSSLRWRRLEGCGEWMKWVGLPRFFSERDTPRIGQRRLRVRVGAMALAPEMAQDRRRRNPSLAGLANPRTVRYIKREVIHNATRQESLLTRED